MKKIVKKIKEIIILLIFKRYIHLSKNSHLFLDGKSRFSFEKNSKININGSLICGVHCKNNNKYSFINLEKNSQLSIKGKVSIFYGTEIILSENAQLFIGNNTFINSNTIIRCKNDISIGNNCAISFGVSIMDSDFHNINGKINEKPVVIEDNVWIGAGATILSGVTIGSGSVIAAGTVVNSNVPKNCLFAGVPGKVKKENIKWSL